MELQARATRDYLMARNEEEREAALAKWDRLFSTDPFDVTANVLQATSTTPFLGQMQWVVNEFANAVIPALDPDYRGFNKRFFSTPFTGTVQRLYDSTFGAGRDILKATLTGKEESRDRALTKARDMLISLTPGSSYGKAVWNLINLRSNQMARSPSTSTPFGALQTNAEIIYRRLQDSKYRGPQGSPQVQPIAPPQETTIPVAQTAPTAPAVSPLESYGKLPGFIPIDRLIGDG
jgi:hypothetical protein